MRTLVHSFTLVAVIVGVLIANASVFGQDASPQATGAAVVPEAVAKPVEADAAEATHKDNAVAAEAAADPTVSEPTVSEPTVSEPNATDNLKSIGGMIVSGGTLNIVFFGILGLFSLWAATVVLERAVNLRRERVLPQAFRTQLAQLTKSTSTSLDQLRMVSDAKSSPASRILHAGVIRAGRPMSEVEKAMEDAVARETTLLRGKYRPLNVIGNISPLVGLLGTVVGMIMAFQISSQEGLGKAEQLAEGIYLALMTTAAGLTIAIPCLLFASWFQARGERYVGEVADILTDTLPCFARLESHSPINRIVASDTNATIEISSHSKEQQAAEAAALSVRERFLRDGVFEPVKG